jgi:hypothetical protein
MYMLENLMGFAFDKKVNKQQFERELLVGDSDAYDVSVWEYYYI